MLYPVICLKNVSRFSQKKQSNIPIENPHQSSSTSTSHSKIIHICHSDDSSKIPRRFFTETSTRTLLKSPSTENSTSSRYHKLKSVKSRVPAKNNADTSIWSNSLRNFSGGRPSVASVKSHSLPPPSKSRTCPKVSFNRIKSHPKTRARLTK